MENKFSPSIINIGDYKKNEPRNKYKGSLAEQTKIEKNVLAIAEYQAILRELFETVSQLSTGQSGSGGGGGGNVNDLEKRVSNLENTTNRIEKELLELKSSTKENALKVELSIKEAIHNLSKQIDDSIKQLPNEDKVRNIVREVLKEEDIATKTYVRERVTKAQLWLYVTFGTAVLSLIVTAIRLFMK